MTEPRTIELLVAVHFNRPDRKFVVVSIDGESINAKSIPRSQISSFHETGKTTEGVDRYGQYVRLPLANMVIPEWLATKEGFV